MSTECGHRTKNHAQWPLILWGSKAASLSSGGIITPYRSKLRKSLASASDTPGPTASKQGVCHCVLFEFRDVWLLLPFVCLRGGRSSGAKPGVPKARRKAEPAPSIR